MDQPCFVQQRKPIKQLLGENTDKRRAQASELVLLDQLVQIDAEQFKDKAEMLLVNEGILKS